MRKVIFLNNNTLFILGMHRSGTSAICRFLERSGVNFGGNLIPPSDDNLLGFWEDRDFVDLNNQLLGNNTAWRQIALHVPVPSSNWELSARKFIKRKRRSRNDDGFIGLKDPRLCRTIVHWLPLFEKKPKVVFVIRHPMAVARSLNRRDNISIDYALALWFVHNYEALKSLQIWGVDFRIVNYDRVMASGDTEIQGLQSYLGLKTVDTSAFEKNLQHQKSADSKIDDEDFILNIATKLWLSITSGMLDCQNFELPYQKLIAIYEPFRELSSELDDMKGYASHVESDIKQVQQETEKYREEKNSLQDYVAHLEKDIGSLKQDVERFRKEKSGLQDYVAHLEQDLRSLRTEAEINASLTSDFRKTISEKVTENNKVTAKLAQTEKDFERLSAEYKDMLEKYEQMETVRWQVDQILQNTYGTLSWRLTAPFRFSRKIAVDFWNKVTMPVKWAASIFVRKLSAIKLRAAISSRQNAAATQAMVDERSNIIPWEKASVCSSTKLPVIGLSVVLFNNGHWLNTFLKSLKEQNYPLKNIRVVFVDNTSTDDTLEKLNSLLRAYDGVFCSLEVVSRPNLGFGSGHDYAIRSLEADYILISNVDLEFERHAISNAVAEAMGDENTASWEFRQSPYEHPKYVDPVTLSVNWSSHACVLFDRSAYLAVGGYEKRIFMYGEDVELSYRFRRHGYKLKYLPRSVAFHHTYETKGEIKPLQFSGSTTANLLIRCRYGDLSDIFIGYFLLFGLAVKGAGFSGSRKIIWKALPAAFKNSLFFLATRKKTAAYFPFRGFDYDLCREGAFWESSRSVIDGSVDLPLVSVITRTVAGREALLSQATASVMNQTYPAIEHIVVEDGGDATRHICEKISRNSGDSYQIRHLACEKKGRSHAANQALGEIAGEYVVFLDDDDLLYHDHLETLMTEVVRTGSDAAYSLAWDTPVNYRDKARALYSECGHITLPLFRQDFDRDLLFKYNFLPIQSVLFHKKLLRNSIRFDEDLDYLEDWVFWKRISKDSKFQFVLKTTSLYKTPASATENFRRKRLLDDAYKIASKRPTN